MNVELRKSFEKDLNNLRDRFLPLSVSSEMRSFSMAPLTGDRTKFSLSPLDTKNLLQSRHNFHQIRLLTHHLINRLISPRNLI